MAVKSSDLFFMIFQIHSWIILGFGFGKQVSIKLVVVLYRKVYLQQAHMVHNSCEEYNA